MVGTWVNVLAILAGSLIGFFFKKRIPIHLQNTLLSVLSLVVLVIGISGALESDQMIFMILALALGTIFGEALQIEDRLHKNLLLIEHKFSSNQQEGWFVNGFITATLLFGVGAMAIVGSFEAGLNQNYEILYTKSMLDFIAAMLLTASLGIGVAFSALSILIYQGALTLLASSLSTVLTPASIALLSGTGSILIMALAFNMMKVTKFKVTNMLLSLVFALIFGFFV